ncbi:hypothetical protein IQ273_17840 [Nodosilinea sp. LEGE 07298]|uniref:hypothetical protein n=1 Tax=Nodosilinea sp. LEGE 07298 TaxID=2777970 RepID=UPI0018811049|nr:hypothetical protein [Nodosilinea sp. LEGE 07298]MBE9111271.1 hypothetical protein [Nodosilinea sp. LEGE 07298]
MKLKKFAKSRIFLALNILGLTVTRKGKYKVSQIDVRQDTNSYRKLYQYGKPVVVDMSIEKMRWKALATKFDYCHPFVYAVKQACEGDENLNFEVLCNELKKYYELVQPRSMSDCLDFQIQAEFPKPQHTHNTRWPWIDEKSISDGLSPVIQGNKIKKLSAREHGVQHWGPVSHEKLLTEAIKLLRLYESIKEKGYKKEMLDYTDSIVRVYILEKENLEWVAVPIQGQHRVSVASAMGIKSVPVRVMFVIRRVDVELFPLVTKGIFGKEDALSIFDSFFERKHPKVLTQWHEYLSRKTQLEIFPKKVLKVLDLL